MNRANFHWSRPRLWGLGAMLLAGPAAAHAQGLEPAAASAPAAAEAVAAPTAQTAPPAAQSWPNIHRIYANLRPFGRPGAGGLMGDLGYEYIGGINVGIELAPVALGQAAFNSFGVRAKLGYGGKWFAAGATLSSGYPAFFPELGLAFRVGRLDTAYVALRFAWLVSPAVRLPMDGGLEARVPVSKRFALRLDCYAGYASTYPYYVYSSAGIGYILRGKGLTNTTILNVGAGPVFFGKLGGAGLVGVEHRL